MAVLSIQVVCLTSELCGGRWVRTYQRKILCGPDTGGVVMDPVKEARLWKDTTQ
jgi:hypothetical protein